MGLVINLKRRDTGRPLLAAMALFMTAVVAAVYAVKTNNYGGMCEGFRWLFWLLPMWLLLLPDGVRCLARVRAGRIVCLIALAVSVISMADALPQPWSYSLAPAACPSTPLDQLLNPVMN